MESLYFCTPKQVALSELTERLAVLGLVESINTRRPMTAVVYHADTWYSIHETSRPEWDSFEPPQLLVLRDADIQAVFQIDCRASLLEATRPHLCAMIRSFDGWVGLDDGEFSTRLTLAELEESDGSLRSAVAMMGEDE